MGKIYKLNNWQPLSHGEIVRHQRNRSRLVRMRDVLAEVDRMLDEYDHDFGISADPMHEADCLAAMGALRELGSRLRRRL